MSENNFTRSPHRDAILEALSTAPAEGKPIAVIMQIPGIGSRDGLDHMLFRMLKAGEIERRGRGRYAVPVPHEAAQPVTTAPIPPAPPQPQPSVAPIPAAPEALPEAVLR